MAHGDPELNSVFGSLGNSRNHTVGLQTEHLPLHAKVYALAEKYQVSGLKEMALRNFVFIANREACGRLEFANACEIAYASTIDEDRGLRDAIVKALYTHAAIFDEDHVYDLLRKLPDLVFDIAMHHGQMERHRQPVKPPSRSKAQNRNRMQP
ncbi:hypothetical protein EDB81DRAFT_943347 [Dactylonectria macrodidyma]|uniref:Uncharacterized protein n=1 Tax=Dactylonectria macrodidyma TaxID=307937 RepID=A0A9P9FPT1_9HYPO|nr:hypothetical protein EDB81DRAFT_943347 [Dactylonectria macrodidyma]